MEFDTSLDNRVSVTASSGDAFEHAQSDRQSNAKGQFIATWEDHDVAALKAGNIPLTRRLRAYERAPSSPFARKRVKFGKVWKRPSVFTKLVSSNAPESSSPVLHENAPRRAASQSPMKAVKKLCVSSSYGLAPQILSWESTSSPVRKIVTRSAAIGTELKSLSEEDGLDCNTERVHIEIIDDNGQTTTPQAFHEEAETWEDDESEQEVPPDSSFMQSGDAVDTAHVHLKHTQTDSEDAGHPEDGASELVVDQGGSQDVVSCPTGSGTQRDSAKDEHILPDPSRQVQGAAQFAAHETANPQPKSILKNTPLAKMVALPEGFVSPVKRRISVKERMAASAAGKRRRTLPIRFSPAVVGSEDSETLTGRDLESVTEVVEELTTDVDSGPPLDEIDGTGADVGRAIDEWKVVQQADSDDDWEDVFEAVPESSIPSSLTQPHAEELLPLLISASPLYTPQPISTAMPDHISDLAVSATSAFEAIASPTKATLSHESDVELSKAHVQSSPAGNVRGREDTMPDELESSATRSLALRHSLRRKSSSPIRESNIMQSKEAPQFPDSRPVELILDLATIPSLTSFLPSDSGEDDAKFDKEEDLPLERSTSAPPEEVVYQSPKRQPRPRVSDDTALLQAFLNRAAERRTTRRMSAAKRESIENIRDSDSVRQALASSQTSPPESRATGGVLGEMDPNSPSPRKQSLVEQATAAKKSNLKRSTSDLHRADDVLAQQQLQNEAQQEVTKPSRRSARDKRISHANEERAGAAIGPNKIAVRPNADPVVLKKSEAQELAMLTRLNTRKNKGGSLLPVQKLIKLTGGEASPESEEAEVVVVDTNAVEQERPGRVRWREVLADYSEAPFEPVSELLQLSDSGTPMLQAEEVLETTDADDATSQPPIAPCDTPSKPKIRRLRPPRTASTPTINPVSVTAITPKDVDEVVPSERQTLKPKAVVAKQRSKITTPAKRQLDLVSILPKPKMPTAQPQPHQAPGTTSLAAEKKLPAKRKAVTSRLPAPATMLSSSLSNDAHSTSLNMSSPPKKKSSFSSSLSSATGAAAPKLDFDGLQTKLSFQTDSATTQQEVVPGLRSPAKKGAGRKLLYSCSEGTESFTRGKDASKELAGLSSPALKRSVRR